MKKKFVVLLIFLFVAQSYSQNEKLIPIKIDSVSVLADSFVGFDGFNHCIYVKKNTLFKKNELQTLQYQNIALGKITRVDITNPLKIIVFYEDFNTVIVLDNQLNEIQKIDFSKLETPVLASAIGISGQNKLWVFNALNQQIGLFDLNSTTYQNISNPLKENSVWYYTDFNYFHWIDTTNNWYYATIFGRIVNNGKVEITNNLQLLSQNKLLFAKENKLYLRDRNLNKLYVIEIIEKSFKNFYFKDQILSIFTEQEIINYKLNIP